MAHDDQPLDPDEERFFRALAHLISSLPKALDADLQRDQHLPLVNYACLMHLSESPGRMLRMSDLAARCDLSVSGMTRVVSRLEHAGLVRRARCDQDARGANAVLTDAGMARLREAYPAHLKSVRRRVVDHFEGQDLSRMAESLEAVLESCGSAGKAGEAESYKTR
ncbi:MAG: MarR family transcriptional regulator [Candidatus Nanopelagicales bacterium]|nr:MarR family transcriptional regulator [Candidatus Nanopelagicales bacterium]MDZ4249826.1 MarR family transcriptional regulator [Candidatus Nanopelagicales bacterium]